MTDNDFRFRFAERCLYDYKTNVARLEVPPMLPRSRGLE